MREEALWNGITLLQSDAVFPLGADAVLLAGFARVRTNSRVCDLGCGSGAISIMLLANDRTLRVTGVELDAAAAALSRKNAAHNQLIAEFSVLEADIRTLKEHLEAGSFDHVVSNPPYFPAGKTRARCDRMCPLPDLCAAAAHLLHPGGRFTLSYRPERLCELFLSLCRVGLEPKRLRLVRHHADAAVSIVLVEAVLCAKPGLCMERDLLIDSPEAATFYHKTPEEQL